MRHGACALFPRARQWCVAIVVVTKTETATAGTAADALDVQELGDDGAAGNNRDAIVARADQHVGSAAAPTTTATAATAAEAETKRGHVIAQCLAEWAEGRLQAGDSACGRIGRRTAGSTATATTGTTGTSATTARCRRKAWRRTRFTGTVDESSAAHAATTAATTKTTAAKHRLHRRWRLTCLRRCAEHRDHCRRHGAGLLQ